MANEASRPWQGRTSQGALGDAGPYTAVQWSETWKTMIGTGAEKANRGVIRGVEDELEVTANSPTAKNVLVETGAALVQGRWYHNTAIQTLTIDDNASGSIRFDLIILRADYTAQTVRLAVLKGTPGAGLPALTQTLGTIYEIPLAAIELASGFTSVTSLMITDMREYANIPANIGIDVTNSSGVGLATGDVLIWLTAGGVAVDDTTTPGDSRIAGVLEGVKNAGAVCRIITQGIFPVMCNESVAVGDYLETSTTSKQARKMLGGVPFARVLVANAGAGTRALCYINVPVYTSVAQCRVYHNAVQNVTVGSPVLFNSERYDTATMHDTVTNNSRITIRVAGLYRFTVHIQGDNSGYAFAIQLNGTTDIARQLQAGSGVPTSFSAEWRCAVGDYVEIINRAGVTIAVASASAYSPEFSASWVSA